MNTIYRPLALAVVVALVLIVLFAAAAMAQDEPVTLPVTGAGNASYEYITQLDELRGMARPMLAHPEVYEFSSDLAALNTMTYRAAARAVYENDANAFITALDQMRTMQSR